MNAYEKLLTREIREAVEQLIQQDTATLDRLVELHACQALEEIKTVIFDDGLSDSNCKEIIAYIFDKHGLSNAAEE